MPLAPAIGMSDYNQSGLTGRVTFVCCSLNMATTLLLYAESVVAITPQRRDMALNSVLSEGKRRDRLTKGEAR